MPRSFSPATESFATNNPPTTAYSTSMYGSIIDIIKTPRPPLPFTGTSPTSMGFASCCEKPASMSRSAPMFSERFLRKSLTFIPETRESSLETSNRTWTGIVWSFCSRSAASNGRTIAASNLRVRMPLSTADSSACTKRIASFLDGSSDSASFGTFSKPTVATIAVRAWDSLASRFAIVPMPARMSGVMMSGEINI